MRNMILAIAAIALVASSSAQVVLGNGKGKVRAVNALAPVSQNEPELHWSRRDFQDARNNESFGFWPAYTIQVNQNLFDWSGEPVGFSPDTELIPITTVPSLVSAGWPAQFNIPRYLFRQGGVYTNRSSNGDHSVIGTAWIKYELDDSNPNGWNIQKVQVFAWDVRDLIHRPTDSKTRSFSDTAAPYQIDIYVASTDSNPSASPEGNPEWTLVGTLSKADGTLPNVCEWNPTTGNTFGECPQATLDYLSGSNPLNLPFYQDPTNELWYSTLNVSGQSGIRYVALVFPRGNQYGQDPTLNASNRTSSSLRYTNITDVRVVAAASVPGDVDGNGCVDDSDLLRVLFAFGGSGNLPEDLNGDSVVDDADLLIVLFNFGSGC